MELHVNTLQKSWADITVSFSAHVAGGHMLVVCGHSGSGKSTVLRMIAGLLPSDSGSVLLDSADITRAKPAKRSMGMVFQSHALFPHMTVVDNVAYGLVCRGVSKKEARAQATEFLAHFGFTRSGGFLERYPEHISGGEAQRVSLARTLIVKPSVVLFDEPLSSLDVPLRRKLSEEILALQQEQHFAGIYVTHDIAEAKTVADTITVMHNGCQVWNGTPDSFSEENLL